MDIIGYGFQFGLGLGLGLFAIWGIIFGIMLISALIILGVNKD